jgi:hypothetical protein
LEFADHVDASFAHIAMSYKGDVNTNVTGKIIDMGMPH